MRQRVEFSATYVLESDDTDYALTGDVNLEHGDVIISTANLNAVSGVAIYIGASAGT